MKKYSASPAIKENSSQNHTKIPPHYFRIVATKITKNSKCWQGCGEKGTLIHCWWEWKLVQSVWKTIWSLLTKLKIDLPYGPSIPFLGIYLNQCESG
jgi:hypothetical protein